MSTLASLWAKYYHMEGMELGFMDYPKKGYITLRVVYNDDVIFHEPMDYCKSCSRKKQQNTAKLELLKKLNILYVSKYA